MHTQQRIKSLNGSLPMASASRHLDLLAIITRVKVKLPILILATRFPKDQIQDEHCMFAMCTTESRLGKTIYIQLYRLLLWLALTRYIPQANEMRNDTQAIIDDASNNNMPKTSIHMKKTKIMAHFYSMNQLPFTQHWTYDIQI